MIAISLVLMGLVGIFALYARSLALNRDVVNRTIAAGLAAEGVEIVKNIVDTHLADGGGWTIGTDTFEIAWDSASYLAESGLPLRVSAAEENVYNYNPSGVLTPFRRTVTAISQGANDEEYAVRSRVEWSEHGVTRSLEVEDHFFNWRP